MLGAIFELEGIAIGDLDSFVYPEKGKKSANFSAAFYYNKPPSPRKVVAILQDLMGKYKI
jgi:hypothetical protein